MPFKETDYEGYLHIDHRGSPGMPVTFARVNGLDPTLCGEGKVFEAATLACAHCPSVFIKNPLRERERSHCLRCNGYICDACEIASKDPSYVHRSRQELIDILMSGKFTLSGSMSLPILTPTEGNNG